MGKLQYPIDNVPTIVGGGCAGAVIATVIAVSVIFPCRKRRRKRHSGSDNYDTDLDAVVHLGALPRFSHGSSKRKRSDGSFVSSLSDNKRMRMVRATDTKRINGWSPAVSPNR